MRENPQTVQTSTPALIRACGGRAAEQCLEVVSPKKRARFEKHLDLRRRG